MATVSTNNSESAQVVADNLGKELEGTGEIVVVANDSKSKIFIMNQNRITVPQRLPKNCENQEK